MRFSYLHPSEQIARIMSRIYTFGLTTTSGGNISIKDEEDNIWITPSAVDKGNLHARDIVCIDPSGKVNGIHEPSSELPFHQAIYEARPDLRSVIHAHPSALVSFSIVRRTPDTTIIPQAFHVCGEAGYAKYQLPGSDKLGSSIATKFQEGFRAVIMENHGTVVGGTDLEDAFQRFETLEFAAKTELEAATIGSVQQLNERQLKAGESEQHLLPEMNQYKSGSKELKLRNQMVDLVRRAYRQRLIISTYGSFSQRLATGFITSPYGHDRNTLEPEDMVAIQDGKREKGKVPSRSVLIQEQIYRDHPEVNSIIIAQPPFATAFAVCGKSFNTKTIPESYILLREIPVVPYVAQITSPQQISQYLASDKPILLLENNAILVTGSDLLQAFDRLEVAEFCARSLVESYSLGQLEPISDIEVTELKRRFFKDQ